MAVKRLTSCKHKMIRLDLMSCSTKSCAAVTHRMCSRVCRPLTLCGCRIAVGTGRSSVRIGVSLVICFCSYWSSTRHHLLATIRCYSFSLHKFGLGVGAAEKQNRKKGLDCFPFFFFIVRCLRGSLSINALHACVSLYTRQLSSFRAPTLWFIDLTVATCHIQYSKRAKHKNTLFNSHWIVLTVVG